MAYYDFSGCLPDIVPEVDWSQFSDEVMLGIVESLETHVSMSNEVYSQSVPSGSDLRENELRRQKDSLERHYDYEIDWRDKEIKRLEVLVDELYVRIDRLS